MKCPHCRESYFEKFNQYDLGEDKIGKWFLRQDTCPSCQKFILILQQRTDIGILQKNLLVWPKGSMRPPCPNDVPEEFASDYGEACVVLPDSAKASAALSRRCLQHLLREVAKVKPADLANEIQELLAKGTLPPQISDALDAVRSPRIRLRASIAAK